MANGVRGSGYFDGMSSALCVLIDGRRGGRGLWGQFGIQVGWVSGWRGMKGINGWLDARAFMGSNPGPSVFSRAEIAEILNLQPRGSLAKPYQVKQVRTVIVRYNCHCGRSGIARVRSRRRDPDRGVGERGNRDPAMDRDHPRTRPSDSRTEGPSPLRLKLRGCCRPIVQQGRFPSSGSTSSTSGRRVIQ